MNSKRGRQNNLQKSFKRPRLQNENPLDFRYEDNILNSNYSIPPWEDFEGIKHLINNGEQPTTKSYDCDNCNHDGCHGCGPSG